MVYLPRILCGFISLLFLTIVGCGGSHTSPSASSTSTEESSQSDDQQGDGSTQQPGTGGGSVIVSPPPATPLPSDPIPNPPPVVDIPEPSGNPYHEYCKDIQFSSSATTTGAYGVCLLVNEFRNMYGAAPLIIRQDLNVVAYNHAKDMHDNGYFNHTNLQGKDAFDRMKAAGISYRAAGENIAVGSSTADQVMDQWMNSSGHRTNILNSKFEYLGVGYYSGSKGYKHYWVQLFIAD